MNNIEPTYYVRHPDGTISIAVPQPTPEQIAAQADYVFAQCDRTHGGGVCADPDCYRQKLAREARVEPIAGPSSGARSDKATLPAASAAPVEAVEVLEQRRCENENAAFQEWWQAEGQAAEPLHTLVTKNAAHAAWQERASRLVAQPPQAVQEDERDAKRYRFLRAWEARRWRLFVSNGDNPLYHAALDDAVDAAISATTKEN